MMNELPFSSERTMIWKPPIWHMGSTHCHTPLPGSISASFSELAEPTMQLHGSMAAFGVPEEPEVNITMPASCASHAASHSRA